jgi:hypothetical protein
MSQPANILELMRYFLSSMDITDYEPAVPDMLVELFFRYVTDVLKEAQRSCEFRKKKEIDDEDLRFATATVVKQSLLHAPPLDTMQMLARRINAQPLPPIPDVPEVVLPSEETSLLSSNFQVAGGVRDSG